MNKKQMIKVSAILVAAILMFTSIMMLLEKQETSSNKLEDINIELNQQLSEDEEHNSNVVSDEDSSSLIPIEKEDKNEMVSEESIKLPTVSDKNDIVKPLVPSVKPQQDYPPISDDHQVETEIQPPTKEETEIQPPIKEETEIQPPIKEETEIQPPIKEETETNPPKEDETENDNVEVTPESSILIVDNDDLTNGELIVSNDKFSEVQVNVTTANAKIVFDNVHIEENLLLHNGHSYTVEVKDSSVKKVELQQALSRSSDTEEVTLILSNVQNLQEVNVDGNININGDIEIPNVNITSGNVMVDVLSDVITIGENANNVEVTVNKDTAKVENNGTESIIKVNSSVETLSSNGTNSSIYIKEDATVKNAIMNGDSERVMGNGTLENATVNGSNVGIFTNINQNNVTVNGSNVIVGQEENVKIEAIKLGQQGTIVFTLNEATEKPLTINDISIICHGGKSMTVVGISTVDNKTYSLSTAYYKDNTYELYVTLPNGKVISKEFLYSYNHPTASEVTVNRNNETEAVLDIYGVDEGGYLYYALVEKEITRNSEVITQEYLKENGTKVNLVTGYNEIKISNLDSSKKYDVFYMMESFDGRKSPVYSDLTIGEYVAPSEEDYVIESIEEVEINKIVFNFNKPVENLKVENIEMVCPLGTILTTTNATLTSSNGGKTWTMVIPQNYQHADNKYTATVTLSDGTVLQGTFVTHFNYPIISGEFMTRPTEDKLRFEFSSDEHGTVYYGLYEWNEEYNSNSNNPKVEDVLNGKIEGTNQQDLVAGQNVIELEVGTVTKYTRLWIMYVDYAGNYRTGWTDYHKVVEYVPPTDEEQTPEVETTLEISEILVYEGWNGTAVDVLFNESLIRSINQEDVILESISGMTVPSIISKDIWWDSYSPDLVSIEFRNTFLTAGDYKITIETVDSNGNVVKVSKEFTVN